MTGCFKYESFLNHPEFSLHITVFPSDKVRKDAATVISFLLLI